MHLIGQGMTADVYELTPNRVAKVFHSDFSSEAVQYERRIVEAVSTTSVPTGRYLDFLLLDGKPAIVLEKVTGENFLTHVLGSLSRLGEHLDLFVETQATVFSQSVPSLPRQTDRFHAQIDRSGLDAGVVEVLHQWVEDLPPGESLCHGDFHFGNLIYQEPSLFVLDWMNAYTGHPLGDVARSSLMIRTPYDPSGLSGPRKLFFLAMKALAARWYLAKALRRLGLSRVGSHWWAVVAAVRLADRVPGEREWLLNIVKTNMNRGETP